MGPGQCSSCRHGELKNEMIVCKAYPDGVPFEIEMGDITHDTVLDGQNGKTIWEPIDGFEGAWTDDPDTRPLEDGGQASAEGHVGEEVLP